MPLAGDLGGGHREERDQVRRPASPAVGGPESPGCHQHCVAEREPAVHRAEAQLRARRDRQQRGREGHAGHRDQSQRAEEARHLVPHRPAGLGLQHGRAGQAEQGDGHQTGEHRIALPEEVPRRAGEQLVADGDTAQQAAEQDALGERRDERADPEQAGPGAVGDGPVERHLDRETAEDQGEDHHKQRYVEAGQRGRVGVGHAGPQAHRQQDQPRFVPVPDVPDDLEHLAAAGGIRLEQREHADAKVISVEDDVGEQREDDGDHQEEQHFQASTGATGRPDGTGASEAPGAEAWMPSWPGSASGPWRTSRTTCRIQTVIRTR